LFKAFEAEDEVVIWSFPSWPEVEVREQLTRACTMKQVKQIMMAADETTGKVCIMTPVLATQKRLRSKAAIH